MTKFNTSGVKSRNGDGFLTTTNQAFNHAGSLAYSRDEKSELFVSAVSDFVKGSFYESENARLDRTISLVKKVVAVDPEWVVNFASWLRGEGNMRTISLVIALEGAYEMVRLGIPGGRALVSSVLQRADEPSEALAYAYSTHGRKLPSAIKRGIADAVSRLYNEYSVSKYNSSSRGFSFADTLKVTHPKPKDNHQSDLFEYVLSGDASSNLKMINKREDVLGYIKNHREDSEAIEKVISDPDTLKEAGLTWEAVAGSAGLSAATWEALIPTMGYMALLRNLRNFQKYEVSSTSLKIALDRIADPEQVAKSKQFPFRFLSAYNANKDNLRVAYALEDALEGSLVNVPRLSGKTLILVDRSGSMFGHFGGSYNKSTQLDYADTAAIFGSTLALRAESAKLVQFGTTNSVVRFRKGDSVLKTLEKFKSLGGTYTSQAVKDHYDSSFDRVIILTDEQSFGGRDRYESMIDKNTPLYVFNLAGYRTSDIEAKPNRYQFAGLNDTCFRLIPLLEAGKSAGFPWEVDNQ